jgi:hypothetical protein
MRGRLLPNSALLLSGPLRKAPCSLRSLVAIGWKALQENASVSAHSRFHDTARVGRHGLPQSPF